MSALTVYGHKTVCTVANLGFQNCKVAYEMFSGPASHSAISERLDLSLSDTLDAIEAGDQVHGLGEMWAVEQHGSRFTIRLLDSRNYWLNSNN